MASTNWFCFSFVLLLNFVITLSGNHETTTNLRKKILANYSTKVRPVLDRTKPINIAAKMHIFHIDSLNEKEQSVKIHGLFQMSWMDERIKWNPEDFNDTKFILLRNYDVWTPNIVLANTAKHSSVRYTWNLPIKVWHSSIMYASPEFALDVSCSFDFFDYPYDEQTCVMGFYASGYSLSELNWTKLMDPEIRMYWPAASNKTQISKWKLKEPYYSRKFWSYDGLTNKEPNKTETRWVLPIIEITLRFNRNDIYFVSTIVLPAILTSMLSVLAMCPFVNLKSALFLLLITFIIQCFYVDNLIDCIPPTVNGVPKVAIFYGFNLCATTLGVILRVLVLYLIREKEKRDKAIQKAFDEQINQERLPQIVEQDKKGIIHELLQLNRLNYMILIIYVFSYFLCAILNFFI